MIHSLIVDDEPLGLNELKYMLSRYNDVNVAFESDNMSEALQLLERHELDLVFLDIEMDNEKSGLKIARKISEQESPPKIIFVTAHPQHALKAYDFQPLHYLLKPISEEKLDQAVQRVRDTLDGENHSLHVETYGKKIDAAQLMKPAKKITIKYKTQDQYNDTIRPTVYLTANEILYIHKDKLSNTTNVFTVDGKQFEGVRQTLKSFEGLLADNDFFRIHTSYLVNLEYVQGLKPRISGDENNLLILKGSAVELSVSKLKIAALKSLLESGK